MLRALSLSALLALTLAGPLKAQGQADTLADIRQELSVLFVEIQRLRRELSTTGAPTGIGQGGGSLQRLDAIEAEMRRLTSATEALELRVNRVVNDGTNRVGDLEFRLCELEPGCDIASLGDTPSLGGEPVAGLGPAPATGGGSGSGTALALGEQSDFDRAMAAYEEGDYVTAAAEFEAFAATYPGGALSAEAHFYRGESEAAQGAWNRAARAYLESFSAAPDGPRAPESLLWLGTSLHRLGQTEEACLTLAEVEVRYPSSAAASQSRTAMSSIGCN